MSDKKPSATGTYLKLERGDDWGAQYLSRLGKSKSDQGTCQVSLGINFKPGSVIRILWPNGKREAVKIALKQFNTTVDDMGHEYPVSYSLAGFKTKFNGIERWVCLDEVRVWSGDLPVMENA